jgi:hypothetical protein
LQDLADEFNDAQPIVVDYKLVDDYPTIKAVACERELSELEGDTVAIMKHGIEIQTKQTKTIEEVNRINRERLPKAKLMLDNKDNDNKRMKLDDQALRDEVIDVLANNGDMSFDDINKIVDQPRVVELLIRTTCKRCWTSCATKRR